MLEGESLPVNAPCTAGQGFPLFPGQKDFFPTTPKSCITNSRCDTMFMSAGNET